ncbi:MAG: hypothetical protein KKG47_14780 [Proteobacteria bacterium]|nr:hypothetical protein [Pseudomonadota bacterium]MBU1739843.1 hypothetical protein [Pseudomonadota bacterium]
MTSTGPMFTYFRLQSAVALVLLFFAASPFPAIAEEAPETLVVRPERLPAKTRSDNSLVPARDPFIWPLEQLRKFDERDEGSKKDPFADFKLNGILWTGREPVAIINNKPLRQGETIDGARVQSIEKDSVILANRKTSRTLRFPDPFIELKKENSGGKK